ncbi:protein of unknown function (plasmid) [Magnetospirillum sp. XM-1]|uniref:hypothetical protein n=1 Tax=unclassified Magnetospirillum TaxID=2617991 RepID=UPI00073E0F4F|nr:MULTISPECIES: hypothetical protein [unclassified Magnetospirillum]ARJ66061.1 hypothetical protein WV31_10520 [Magnetospirillum sp. ME-1]CUW41940.1 protein of unknown function [Magnetospirillum sp. XM-1]
MCTSRAKFVRVDRVERLNAVSGEVFIDVGRIVSFDECDLYDEEGNPSGKGCRIHLASGGSIITSGTAEAFLARIGEEI